MGNATVEGGDRNGRGNNRNKKVLEGQDTGRNVKTKKGVVLVLDGDSSDTGDAAGSRPRNRRSRFSINLSGRSLLLSFCLSFLLAFAVGWAARLARLSQQGGPLAARRRHGRSMTMTVHDGNDDDDDDDDVGPSDNGGGMSKKNALHDGSDYDDDNTRGRGGGQLPAPRVIEGKDVPFATYASKTFQDDGWVPRGSNACSRGSERGAAATDDHNDDSDGLQHLPAGQHLLVDMKGVDSGFLNSEERLATAMIEVIDESRLTLLSCHCRSLVPIGVSCAGVLLGSRVALHTWPSEGVISMDVFARGGGPLIPMLPSLGRFFGVPGGGAGGDGGPRPTMLWSHKLRGFRGGFAPGHVRSADPLGGSLGRRVLGRIDLDAKRPLLLARTARQSVSVYEVAGRRSPRGRGGPHGSYRAPGSSTAPDKILSLNGAIQSSLRGDAPHHESIVHPAMLVHPDPRRVAIIGGGEGAALREVLKHRGVEEVVMLEIDEELVPICAEHMPEWSDCGDIDGGGGGDGAASCFDDPRARVIFADAFGWFVDRFGENDVAGTAREGGGAMKISSTSSSLMRWIPSRLSNSQGGCTTSLPSWTRFSTDSRRRAWCVSCLL